MRNELRELISLSRRLLDNDEPGTLATLFSARGSSYRSLGSMMISGPPGITAGGVSGGCLEEYIARQGREMTRDRPAVVLSFDTGSGDEDDPKPVLGCGGSLDVLVERLTPRHLAHLERMAEAHDADVASLMACTIDMTTDSVAVDRRWGACGLEATTSALAQQALEVRRSYCERLDSNHKVLVHYIPPMTRLVIFGAGDDVRPVCDLARSLGWHVTVADRRARHARADRFPSADVVIAEPWERAIERTAFTANTSILLMTHSLPDDAILLPLLASSPRAYLGVLGPAHRRETLMELIRENGTGEDLFPDLHGPIGLDLGDRSAPGIAVSVIAQIMAHLNDRSARSMSASASESNALITDGPVNGRDV